MKQLTRPKRLLLTLGLSSAVSIGLLTARFIATGTAGYWFLIWNLFLAWLPLTFAAWLGRFMRGGRGWLTWQGTLLTVLWLIFLPNTFYIISDIIHLKTLPTTNLLYDAAFLLSFVWNGLLLGFIGLYFMHRQLLLRLKRVYAHEVVAAILLVCSFGVYLGRYLRWNTWDILVNPTGLLFDVSERVIHPGRYPETFITTLTFFILLGSMYVVVWQLIKILSPEQGS